MLKERLATLISGGGTTMQEIIKACQSGEIPMEVACVIASTPRAGGLDKAFALGIHPKNIVVVDPLEYVGENNQVDEEGFGTAILEELEKRGVSVITQNGWLPHTPAHLIDRYRETMFNQHPGPVPEFGGKGMFGRRVHQARLEFVNRTQRDFWTEAVAQRVHPMYDQGIVVKSRQVDIHPDDTANLLQQRVLPVEHRVQIEMLQDVASGNIQEMVTRTSLIRPGEEDVLLAAKQIARQMFPDG